MVVAKIKEISTIYRIKEVAYDEWMAEYPVQDLDRAGFRLAPVKNNAKGMTAPMRELESLVLNSQLVHGCNPILTWNAQNLGAKEDDATGSLKPMKSNRASKNDGMLALMFALSTTLRHQANPPRTSTALERILAGRDKAA